MAGDFFPLRKTGSSIDPKNFPALPPVQTTNQKNKDGSGRTKNLLPPLPPVNKVNTEEFLPPGFYVYVNDRKGEQVAQPSENVRVPKNLLPGFELLAKRGVLGKYAGNLLLETSYSRTRGRDNTVATYSIHFSPRHIVPITHYGNQIIVFQFGTEMKEIGEEIRRLTEEARQAHLVLGEQLNKYRLSRYLCISLYREFLRGVIGLQLQYSPKEMARLAKSKIQLPSLLDLIRDQLDLETIEMVEEVDLPAEWLAEIL